MSSFETLYPATVADVPADLTLPNAAYRSSVRTVFCSLLLFLLFYLALIGACIYAVFAIIGMDGGSLTYMAIIPVILALFLVKALLKWNKRSASQYVEVTEADQPELFEFLRRLCADTRAPFPHKVFLSHDVNAAVTYDTSILNLVMPLKKDLVIGLGLVNMLTLSEFKAVLAHEFGHFSQSSLRLGIYVYTANRIIADMVFGRDWFDTALKHWRRVDLRLSFPAWIIYGIVSVLRWILEQAFKGINFVDRSLSRQMEFHADLVAVSVAGSDMIVHALRRLELADACMAQTMDDLKAAYEHKMLSSDLYTHQEQAIDYVRSERREPDFGAPPPLPEEPTAMTQVFSNEDAPPPSMWSSHPPNHEREKNAKRHYVRSAVDGRPAWTLFRSPEKLREQVTRVFYERVAELPAPLPIMPAARVEGFIAAERRETRQDSRYGGLYDGRLIEIPEDIASQTAARDAAWTLERIAAVAAKLYGAEYKEWLEKHTERYTEFYALHAIQTGEVKVKTRTIPFRGADRPVKEIPQLLEQVGKELTEDQETFKQIDGDVLHAHLQMAILAGEDSLDLINRYRFQYELQTLLKRVRNALQSATERLSAASEKRDGLSQEDWNSTHLLLLDGREALRKTMERAYELPLPALENLQAGSRLSEFLLNEPLVSAGGLYEKGEWVDRFMRQISEVEARLRRLHFKSIGAILARQEAIADAWQSAARLQPPAEAPNALEQ